MPNVLLFCENIFIIEAEQTRLKIFTDRKYFQPLFLSYRGAERFILTFL